MIAPVGLVPAPPYADIERVRAAALLARTVLPSRIGDFLARDLGAWCEHGHRYDNRGEAVAIAEELETLARAMRLGRTP